MINFKWVKDDRDEVILYKKNFGNSSKKRRDFIIHWERNLDWSGNPFTDTILFPVSSFKSGREEESKILNKFFIQGKKFGVIKGEKGVGKTFILKWLEEELKTYENQFDIFYFDAKTSNHKTLIKNLMSHFTTFSFFNNPENLIDNIKSKISKSKKIIFLIDDADNLSKESLILIKQIKSINNIHLILTISEDFDFKDFGEDELNLTLSKLETEYLKEMIVKRIEYYNGVDIEPFNSIQIKTIAKKANFNPREMLKLCNEKAVEISIQKKDSLEEFAENLEIFEVEEDKELIESLPEGVLEGDAIVQEIVGEFNIDLLVEPKSEKKTSKKKTKSK
jgi:hypothetical protein